MEKHQKGRSHRSRFTSAQGNGLDEGTDTRKETSFILQGQKFRKMDPMQRQEREVILARRCSVFKKYSQVTAQI